MDADLPVARIKLGVIRNGDDFVRPILQEKLASGTVARAKSVMVADRPASNGPFGWHSGFATDGSQALTFRHSGTNGVGEFRSVVRLCHVIGEKTCACTA